MIARLFALLALGLVAACQTTPEAAFSSPQSQMVHVARQVQACWFKSKDAAFGEYRMASEVDSYSGRPRILIVPKSNPGGLPLLVAQSERRSGGNSFERFGPLLQSAEGPRLARNLDAWSKGASSC